MTMISADSHVTEPAGTYVDRIDPKYRDRAPRMHYDETLGEVGVGEHVVRYVMARGGDGSPHPPDHIPGSSRSIGSRKADRQGTLGP